jgi:hypothetical protein
MRARLIFPWAEKEACTTEYIYIYTYFINFVEKEISQERLFYHEKGTRTGAP